MVRCASPPVKYPQLPSCPPSKLVSPTATEPTSGLRANTSRRRVRRFELDRPSRECSQREKKQVLFQDAARHLNRSLHQAHLSPRRRIENPAADREQDVIPSPTRDIVGGTQERSSNQTSSDVTQPSPARLGSSAERSLQIIDGVYDALAVDAEELEPLKHSFAPPQRLSPVFTKSEVVESEEEEVHSTHGVPLTLPILQEPSHSIVAQRASIDAWLQKVEGTDPPHRSERASKPRFSTVGRNVLPPPEADKSVSRNPVDLLSQGSCKSNKENQHPPAPPASRFSDSSSSPRPTPPPKNPLRAKIKIPDGSPLRSRPRRTPLHCQETVSKLLQASPKPRGRSPSKAPVNFCEPAENTSERVLENHGQVEVLRRSRRLRRNRCESYDDEDILPNFSTRMKLERLLPEGSPGDIITPKTRARAAEANPPSWRPPGEPMDVK